MNRPLDKADLYELRTAQDPVGEMQRARAEQLRALESEFDMPPPKPIADDDGRDTPEDNAGEEPVSQWLPIVCAGLAAMACIGMAVRGYLQMRGAL